MHLEERLLQGYVDGELDARERGEVDRHLETCAECRALVDDLREIQRVAGTLEHREPPIRAWSRIERGIKLEDDSNGARNPQASGRPVDARLKPSRSTITWLAAAAVLLIATIVGVRYAGPRQASTPPSATAAANDAAVAQASAASVEAELRAAESHYDKAIQGLEQIARTEQSALDPGTAATLQKNLAVIDQAISESRAAIRAQPASEPARESLIDSFRTKLALLQDTVALINEMRKGNEAGAARVVSGLKQKGN